MKANSTTTPRLGRRRWILVGSLIAATALAGAATRGTNPSSSSGGEGQHFSAGMRGPVTFTGSLDKTAVLVGGEPHVRMELVIAGEKRDDVRAPRIPTDLVVVLDRSGSMSGAKLDYARAAIHELIGRLGPKDRFGLVTYDNVASVTIPAGYATDARREAWTQTVAAIPPGGGTNLAAGLDLGKSLLGSLGGAGRAARALLISDGLANQGDVSREGLLGRAAQIVRHEALLTTVGVGADFDESLMTALADAGTGNYYFLESAHGLATVFAREFDAARTTVASALEVRIAPGTGVEVVDAAGYPLERQGRSVVFRPGSLFASQKRRIWVTLRVPNDAAGEHDLGRFSLAWSDGSERIVTSFDDVPRVAAVTQKDDFFAAVDAPSWERSVVVEGYNKMQEEVAREVKAGNAPAARQAIERFRDETREMNAYLKSKRVTESLDSLGRLEAEVDDAFHGEDQAQKQNEMGKTLGAKAYDNRRVGAKR